MLEPLPHQLEGAQILARAGNGLLADEMGLGKGGTFLTWLKLIGAQRTLVTGPKEITSNLLNEIPKWVNDKPLLDLRGYARTARDTLFEALQVFPDFIAILNFDAWRRDHEMVSRLLSLKLDSIVIDEAHHLASGRSLSYRGIRELIYGFNQCGECGFHLVPIYVCNNKECSNGGGRHQFRHCLSCGKVSAKVRIPRCEVCGSERPTRSVRNVLEVTGTPVLNHCHELRSLLSLIDEDIPSERDFLNEYAIPAGNKYIWSKRGKAKLAKRIAPYYVARKRTDAGIRLPPQSIEVREYEWNKTKYKDQYDAYRRLEKEFKIDLDSGTLGVTEVVVQLLRLRQMLVWPKGIPGVEISSSYKMDIAESLAQEFLEAGQRLVVFSHFTEPLRELRKRLGDRSVIYDGSTSPSQREAIRADFSAGTHTPRWEAVLCNYRSAGEGLNLVGATQAIILDEDWSPGKNKQAYGRIDRIGQTKETGVHIIRILDSVDIWMSDLNLFKSTIDSEAILAALEKLAA